MTDKSIDRRLDDLNDRVTRLQNNVSGALRMIEKIEIVIENIHKYLKEDQTPQLVKKDINYFWMLVDFLIVNKIIDSDEFNKRVTKLEGKFLDHSINPDNDEDLWR